MKITILCLLFFTQKFVISGTIVETEQKTYSAKELIELIENTTQVQIQLPSSMMKEKKVKIKLGKKSYYYTFLLDKLALRFQMKYHIADSTVLFMKYSTPVSEKTES